MNTALTLSYIATVLLLIATPGPVVALVVNTASRAGARQALATALGTNWGSLVLIGIAAWIIACSAAIDTRLLGLLSMLGCLFIGYLAVNTLRESWPAKSETRPAPQTAQSGMLHGFMIGLSNPKDIIFFVSFFPQFIQVTATFETSLMLLSTLWVVIDLLVLSTWILVARRLARRGNSRLINLCSGVALLLIALVGLGYNLNAMTSAL